jgi:hypothetical protein
MHPFLRVSASVNDNPERIKALPPFTPDFTDKLLVFKVGKGQMPMPTDTDEQREAFLARIRSELPGFVHFLLHWSIPDELLSGRFGQKPFLNREVEAALYELEPESTFEHLLNKLLFAEENGEAWGWASAQDLHDRMTNDGTNPLCQRARRLLSFHGACGQHLGVLRKNETAMLAAEDRRNGIYAQPADMDQRRRYLRKHVSSGNLWMIKRPGFSKPTKDESE